jgi:hypothetical protein
MPIFLHKAASLPSALCSRTSSSFDLAFPFDHLVQFTKAVFKLRFLNFLKIFAYIQNIANFLIVAMRQIACEIC